MKMSAMIAPSLAKEEGRIQKDERKIHRRSKVELAEGGALPIAAKVSREGHIKVSGAKWRTSAGGSNEIQPNSSTCLLKVN
jgi:hypothetical protein